MQLLLIILYYLRSSSIISITVVPGLLIVTFAGNRGLSIVNEKSSLLSNMASSVIEISKGTIVFPAANVTEYGPEL